MVFYSVTPLRLYILQSALNTDMKLLKLWQHTRKGFSLKGGTGSLGCFCSISTPNVYLQRACLFRSIDILLKRSILIPSLNLCTTTERKGSNTQSVVELKKAIEQLTDQFMEARELIDDARESLGTVYFSEDMDEAQKAVTKTLEQYQNLLSQLSEDQKQEVLRTIGLKMEELKAQEQAIRDTLHDD